MVRRLITGLVLLVWLIPLPSTSHADECVEASGEPLKIGAVFPQAVLLTAASNESYLGAEAMRQAVNACGGVNGRPVEWEWKPAYDRSSAAEALQALSEANVPVIVGSGSGAVSAGAVEAAEIEPIVYWEVSEAVENPGEWVFSPRPNGYQMGQQAAQLINRQFPGARVALVYEERPNAQAVADGILDTLEQPPTLEYTFSDPNDYYQTYQITTQMREESVNVVMLVTFETDGYSLWYNSREADANLDAWLQIGSEGYWQGMCAREVYIDGLMSMTPYAPVNAAYRRDVVGEINRLYRSVYQREKSQPPSLEADLSASGVYLLLHYVLPAVEGDYTAENVRAAIRALNAQDAIGLLGEGMRFEDGVNTVSVAPVRQQQGSQFCTLFPSDIATCSSGIQPFPTWRERAVRNDTRFQCSPDL